MKPAHSPCRRLTTLLLVVFLPALGAHAADLTALYAQQRQEEITQTVKRWVALATQEKVALDEAARLTAFGEARLAEEGIAPGKPLGRDLLLALQGAALQAQAAKLVELDGIDPWSTGGQLRVRKLLGLVAQKTPAAPEEPGSAQAADSTPAATPKGAPKPVAVTDALAKVTSDALAHWQTNSLLTLQQRAEALTNATRLLLAASNVVETLAPRAANPPSHVELVQGATDALARLELDSRQSEAARTNTLAGATTVFSAASNLVQRLAPKMGQIPNHRAYVHVGYSAVDSTQVGPWANTNGVPTNSFRLMEPGSSGSAFVEFVYNDRWAWEQGEDDLEPGWHWAGKERDTFDVQGRLSYTFNNSDASAATIVGSGNFALELSVARHLFRRSRGGSRSSLSVEMAYAGVTDKAKFDIHSTAFAGLSFATSVARPFLDEATGTNGLLRPVLFTMRIGAAKVEIPNISDPKTGEVATKFGVADFESHWGAVAVEGQLMFPVLKHAYLTAGGRLYNNADPNPWSVYIGLTQPIDAILQSFGNP